MTTKPVFEHDCEDCVFLGTEERYGKTIDLYIHVNKHRYSLIGRKSSEPSDYVCREFERGDYI